MYKLKIKEYKKEVITYLFNDLQEVVNYIYNLFNTKNLYTFLKKQKEYNIRIYLSYKQANK